MEKKTVVKKLSSTSIMTPLYRVVGEECLMCLLWFGFGIFWRMDCCNLLFLLFGRVGRVDDGENAWHSQQSRAISTGRRGYKIAMVALEGFAVESIFRRELWRLRLHGRGFQVASVSRVLLHK